VVKLRDVWYEFTYSDYQMSKEIRQDYLNNSLGNYGKTKTDERKKKGGGRLGGPKKKKIVNHRNENPNFRSRNTREAKEGTQQKKKVKKV